MTAAGALFTAALFFGVLAIAAKMDRLGAWLADTLLAPEPESRPDFREPDSGDGPGYLDHAHSFLHPTVRPVCRAHAEAIRDGYLGRNRLTYTSENRDRAAGTAGPVTSNGEPHARNI